MVRALARLFRGEERHSPLHHVLEVRLADVDDVVDAFALAEVGGAGSTRRDRQTVAVR
jgi:transcriptional regulator GlxA family with amidase domain